MATRLKVNPPTRPDGKEVVTYTCEVCEESDITNPHSHVQGRINHDRDVILEGTSMMAWYTPMEEGGMYG